MIDHEGKVTAAMAHLKTPKEKKCGFCGFLHDMTTRECENETKAALYLQENHVMIASDAQNLITMVKRGLVPFFAWREI